ncbi:unnamed protein product [Soboliphyme baturini]|uniref:CCR4-NOT transcription complex subunit 1 n=1 Tax=Soboliphyme baturini TaxID=241478 RepID=A0A183JAG6_9BILA|nr:unnamed protein product [Soboliphyme baturini]
MIKNLFEEYRFFGQYPEKELHTTAQLFGGVIRENLVSGMPILFALRVVMDTLRKEPGSKLHDFGITAIDQFKTRLKDYQRYCQAVMSQVLHFGQFPRNLIQYIQYGARGEEPPSHVLTNEPTVPPQLPSLSSMLGHVTQLSSLHSVPLPSVSSTAPSGTSVVVAAQPSSHMSSTDSLKPKPTLTATNIDTLVSATEKEESKVLVPPESTHEKVAFLFNNLSQANLPQKVSEMKELLVDDQYLPWLAQYLVMKRVSAESNFHNLYSNFVTAMGNRTFNSLILLETYRNIKILLRCDKVMANFSDRTLLKNLGHWLGLITVGQNRPILQRDLDLKTLLFEAFWKGQQELLYVVPFVAKIMESCQKSKSLKPDNILKNNQNIISDRIMKDPQLCNPAKLEKPTLAAALDVSPVPHVQMTPVPGGSSSSIPLASVPCDEAGVIAASAAAAGPTPPRFSYHEIYINSTQGLMPHVAINASLPLFQLNPPLKHIVRPAIEHAVRELLTPVADRALKVALTTTENIVKKVYFSIAIALLCVHVPSSSKTCALLPDQL